ncbi:MAG TPA: hypothetical protein VM262_05530 [Acidimicrobiales bacterium]|nr:hypothetical protein [Acidimicrobiales bacterium]
MPNGDDAHPPHEVVYDLEEALDLLTALEAARDTLRDTEHLAGVLLLEGQIQVLHRKLGLDDGDSDAG